MKSPSHLRADYPSFAFPPVVACLLLCSVLAVIPGRVLADQPESAIACVEGSEPVDMAYGDHANCTIDQPTDLDRFEFCGTADDHVRINVLAPDFMDPVMEIWDPTNSVIERGSCADGCSFTLDFNLPANGCYRVFVSDSGTNETGSYTWQLERIQPVPESVHINYDENDDSNSDGIGPGTDIDFFTFNR